MTFSVGVAHGKIPVGSSAGSTVEPELLLVLFSEILNDTTRTDGCEYRVSALLSAWAVRLVFGRIVVVVGVVKDRWMLGAAGLLCTADAMAGAFDPHYARGLWTCVGIWKVHGATCAAP